MSMGMTVTDPVSPSLFLDLTVTSSAGGNPTKEVTDGQWNKAFVLEWGGVGQ